MNMEESGMSLIVKTTSRLLFPFMFLFGVYVILHGHVTPGGGFPGGVIIASAIGLIILSYGLETAEKEVGEFYVEVSESLGALVLISLGILGIIMVGSFLQGIFPEGTMGELLSGENLPVLNIGVGIKVGAGLVTILYSMLAFKGGSE